MIRRGLQVVFPENRNQFKPRKTKRPVGPKIALLAGLVSVAAIVFWQWPNMRALFSKEPDSVEMLMVFWDEHRYEEINLLCEELLVDDPLKPYLLLYNGFAYFYRGVNQFSFEEKIALFDRCIANLRKAVLLDIGEIEARARYVLGKAYYYKGKYYADLTIDYLEEAADRGYVGEDTHEYLGLAYNTLGDYENSAESFLKAVAEEPTDTRYLALAQAYFNQGLVDRAEEYLQRTVDKTKDPAIEQKTRFLLGKIYFETDQLTKAEDQYRRILEKAEDSADSYYFLGEIYLKYNKLTEARYYWRQAHKIDASHYGARLRLF